MDLAVARLPLKQAFAPRPRRTFSTRLYEPLRGRPEVSQQER
jgi:hypothetical protein